MIFKEINGDLFESDEKYTLVHCISADCDMGKGIAKTFDSKMPQMKKLLKSTIKENNMQGYFAILYLDDLRNVMNLITKERYWHKPTYSSLKASLLSAKKIAVREGIKYLAMPVIGCGLDRLQWSKVSVMIKEVFADTDIEIVVYHK